VLLAFDAMLFARRVRDSPAPPLVEGREAEPDDDDGGRGRRGCVEARGRDDEDADVAVGVVGFSATAFSALALDCVSSVCEGVVALAVSGGVGATSTATAASAILRSLYLR